MNKETPITLERLQKFASDKYSIDTRRAMSAITSIDVLDTIFHNSFLTGSRVFGVPCSSTERQTQTDWDIVIPGILKDQYINDLLTYLQNSHVEKSDYFNGVTIYGYKDTLLINLIPTTKNDYRAWYLATVAFRDMWAYADIDNKEHKVAIFEALRASFRGRLPEIQTDRFLEKCEVIARQARFDTLSMATSQLFVEVNNLHDFYNRQ